MDICKRRMGVALLESFGKVRPPAARQFLEPYVLERAIVARRVERRRLYRIWELG
jgi:hypothetical protein